MKDRLVYKDLLHDEYDKVPHQCSEVCKANYAVIVGDNRLVPVTVQEHSMYATVVEWTSLSDCTITMGDCVAVIATHQTRIVGYVVTNETGKHYLCRGCVTPVDRTFGALASIWSTSENAHQACHICDVAMNEVTHKA